MRVNERRVATVYLKYVKFPSLEKTQFRRDCGTGRTLAEASDMRGVITTRDS